MEQVQLPALPVHQVRSHHSSSALHARWERGLAGKCCSEHKPGESALTQEKYYVTIISLAYS